MSLVINVFDFLKKRLGLRISVLKFILGRDVEPWVLSHCGCEDFILNYFEWADNLLRRHEKFCADYLKRCKINEKRIPLLIEQGLTRQVHFEILGFCAERARQLAQKKTKKSVFEVAKECLFKVMTDSNVDFVCCLWASQRYKKRVNLQKRHQNKKTSQDDSNQPEAANQKSDTADL